MFLFGGFVCVRDRTDQTDLVNLPPALAPSTNLGKVSVAFLIPFEKAKTMDDYSLNAVYTSGAADVR